MCIHINTHFLHKKIYIPNRDTLQNTHTRRNTHTQIHLYTKFPLCQNFSHVCLALSNIWSTNVERNSEIISQCLKTFFLRHWRSRRISWSVHPSLMFSYKANLNKFLNLKSASLWCGPSIRANNILPFTTIISSASHAILELLASANDWPIMLLTFKI